MGLVWEDEGRELLRAAVLLGGERGTLSCLQMGRLLGWFGKGIAGGRGSCRRLCSIPGAAGSDGSCSLCVPPSSELHLPDQGSH